MQSAFIVLKLGKYIKIRCLYFCIYVCVWVLVCLIFLKLKICTSYFDSSIVHGNYSVTLWGECTAASPCPPPPGHLISFIQPFPKPHGLKVLRYKNMEHASAGIPLVFSTRNSVLNTCFQSHAPFLKSYYISAFSHFVVSLIFVCKTLSHLYFYNYCNFFVFSSAAVLPFWQYLWEDCSFI